MLIVPELSSEFPAHNHQLSAEKYDLVIVGAGILGLAHAWHALRLGLRTAVVERDDQAVGASIRNFGHVCITAQSGRARDYAETTRREWLAIGRVTRIDVREVGSTVVLRNELEAAVMAEFAATQDNEVQLLGSERTAGVLGVDPSLVQGGAHFPNDLRLDPRAAVAELARYLQEQGTDFYFGTNVGLIEPGKVVTNKGQLDTKHVVVAVNHDLDRFFPELADQYSVTRCRLRMLEIDAPRNVRIEPAILTGLSLLRYDAFKGLKAHAALREHFERVSPELLEHDLNHMLTQRPDGVLVVGDTHHRARTEHPFELERSDELLISETARLFGVEKVRIRRRWRGIYASSAFTNFVCEIPMPGVRALSVTTGIGMTTSLGFAQESLLSLLESSPQ